MIQVGNRHNRAAGGYDLTQFGLPNQNHPVKRRRQLRVVQHDPGKGQRIVSALDIGFGQIDITLRHLRERFVPIQHRRRLRQSCRSLIAGFRRCVSMLPQSLVPPEIEFSLRQIGLIADDGLLRGFECLFGRIELPALDLKRRRRN